MVALPDIPGYEIREKLGSGGMATVYLAIQQNLDRKIALKIMSASLAADSLFCKRFLKEGKIIAQVSSHPDIVTIYDIGCIDNTYYMAMEYVDGGSLTDLLDERLEPEQAVDIVKRMAGALGYAHNHGFIHRDVKPDNILFHEESSPVLTDFGIAKSLSSKTQLTQAGYAVGTPEYMSPEQARAGELDGRSDLYSLGVVFYQMLTGKRPFRGSDGVSTAMMHINEPVPRLPGRFSCYQPVIDRLLAKSPEDRYANARDLIKALDAVVTDGEEEVLDDVSSAAPTVAMPAGPGAAHPLSGQQAAVTNHVTGAQPVARQRPWGWILGAVFAAAFLVTGGVLYFTSLDREPDSASVDVTEQEPQRPEAPERKVYSDRIERLLNVAEAHKSVGRLREPPGANAYDAYRMVLEIDPDNAVARQGVQEIEAQQGGSAGLQ